MMDDDGLTAESLTICKLENLELPTIPPRSRLYRLEPIRAGTPDVESLTSYLTRLANAHCVPLTKLADLEFGPLLNKQGPNIRIKFNNGAKSLNGGSDWTAPTIAILERLTHSEGLRYLTLYPWRNVLARQKLLRPHLAWCPSCYAEWQQAEQTLYNPLLWHLDAVEICPHHRQALRHHCPNPDCQRELPLVNNRGKLGYCPYCHCWLGVAGVEHPQTDLEWPWQLWLTSQLAEMFIAVQHLSADPQPQTLAHNLEASLETKGPNYATGVARQIGMSSSVIYGCLNHARPIRLDLLGKICYHLDRSLLDMLTARTDETKTPVRRVRPKVDVGALRQQLKPFLNDTPPRSAHQVAQILGVNSNVIQHHFPEQYRQLVERYEQYQQNRLKRRNDQLQHELQAFLQSEEIPPPSLREVARRLQMKTSTLADACPKACRFIAQRYIAYHQIRKAKAEAGLKQILTTDEAPPPSVVEAAARLGENIQYLYKQFPELCRQITQRRSSYQPPKKTKRQPKDHAKIHRQFEAIIATEEKPPPSIREVARRLNCGYTTLRQSHADLCAQLCQQTATYYQTQISGLPAKLAEILAANEAPAPSLRQVANRLGVQSHLLKKVCPDMCAEILRRSQADLQAAKQRRKAFLDQVLTQSDEPPPALTQVAKTLNTTDVALQEQFPEESTLIVRRYQAYKAAEKQRWQDVLQAALTTDQAPPPTLAEVARQLDLASSQKLRFHFSELCQQVLHRRRTYLTNSRQRLQTYLETILAESQVEPPPSLTEIARQLEYDPSTLKRLFPAQVQTIMDRRQHYQATKKLAAEQALKAALEDDEHPFPSLKGMAEELGYSRDTLQRYFPDLTAAYLAKRQDIIKTRSLQSRQQLAEEVKLITRELYQQGIDPTLRQIGLRLPHFKMTIQPHIRQAWSEARAELGLPT